jgi:MFS family permease
MPRWLAVFRRVPRTVWALGLVSLFMDVSSEMVHALLPLFVVGALGASAALVGLIEGLAEATASISKVFSGWLSDRLGQRKWLAVAGYGLAALTKPLFPLAVTPMEVLGARLADRLGKGIRGAPRDALVADVTPPELRGAAFGLRQSLDTVGAFMGPLLAIGLMILLSGDIRGVFAWAVLPAGIAVLLLVLGVEDAPKTADKGRPAPIRWTDVKGMGGAFWVVTALGAVFTLARFSEAFLVLKAADAGLKPALIPAVMVVMSLVYSLTALPAGALADRIDRRLILAAGLLALIAADLILARTHGLVGAGVGVALWGVHMGLTQGLFAAMVADAAAPRLRGTAFGVFNLVSGVALLAASVVAGQLWSRLGPAATFEAGAAFAAITLVGLFLARGRPGADRRALHGGGDPRSKAA